MSRMKEKFEKFSKVTTMNLETGGGVVNCQLQTQPSPSRRGLIGPEKVPGGMVVTRSMKKKIEENKMEFDKNVIEEQPLIKD